MSGYLEYRAKLKRERLQAERTRKARLYTLLREAQKPTCEGCKSPMEESSQAKKFCSFACRQRAYRQRQSA